ncbi:TIGR04282 family arsenosugar biosynthesis glycosyltransferase [Daejeonella sp. H1SJ63]|jgi:hypothetical protein|uniref:TIGR04282 family arsenosugar biosynthesis glycosyltransferase n=1 Tax=Daejeonella sp. H1SJ63 TaxID=3034145 RepID=UPI0023EB60E7|nr:TIGR04282 family arsenosugar biosynthesis glycosyltransferase [Daejeonella sp. H1SJ63]
MTELESVALILFVKDPVPGQVKTRLAKAIGDQKASEVYRILLKNTLDISLPLACPKFVYYAEAVNEDDQWNVPGYIKKLQEGEDLGERMYNAFKDLFYLGFEKVLIIGSDCYDLKTEIIQEGFRQLNTKKVVIGPALDGGYYLLGMNALIPELFFDKAWSTDQLKDQTVNELRRMDISYSLLPELRDIDDLDDFLASGIVISET